jgi:tripartite-type tricarboxylate transporter receptor subunit TctC
MYHHEPEEKRMKKITSTALHCVLVIAAGIAPAPALAQSAYPNKAVRIIVPFPPGGSNDIVARLIGRELSDSTGQGFVVDNRGGASGAIGAGAVAKAAPDGYTLMVHSTSHLSNAFVADKLPYDTLKDFEPVTLLAAQPSVLVTTPSLGAKTVRDFLAAARAQPGKLTYASNGEGGNLHVQMALLASMANLQLVHIPYKGGAEMTTSLISGETHSGVSTIGAVLSQIKAGKVNALGVTSARRSTLLPDLPPIAESVPGYDINAWIGMFGPASLPKPIVDKLYAEVTKSLKKPELAKQMADQGVEPWLATPQEFAARLRTDYDQLGRAFKIIGTPKK